MEVALVLRSENPSKESQISPCVIEKGLKFKNSNSVISYYQKYIRGSHNIQTKLSMFERILPLNSLDENFLIEIAVDAFRLQGPQGYHALSLVLYQPQLTAQGLEQISNLMGHHFGRLNESDKKILSLIERHPNVTSKIKEQNLKVLSGSDK